ncbi:MAG: SDR family NAD(P)-dependent oxidoreductase, partial [Acidimicrobiia bacterium]|nr:SDR family NAD(P)-dependent oxidoreductase [Acidimicrobiia bacterium]
MQLDGKVAIVTGIAAGMGTAIAQAYAAEGAIVVGTDIDDEAGTAVMAGCDNGSYLHCDVGDVAAVRALVDEVAASQGRIDILVNNAGVTKSLGFFDVTEADWDRIHRVNARGLFFCMQAVAAKMAEAKSGRIVNIASIAGKGYRGTSNVAYAGSKGAVIAMTRIAAAQLARYDVNVNSICPGATRTALFEQVMSEMVERRGMSREDALARLDSSIPL